MMLALGIRYLTGYAAAADVSDKEAAEWPVHPARAFMALAAALFETDEDVDQRAALEWLEQQGPPSLHAPGAARRSVVDCYVPPNDMQIPQRPEKIKADAIASALTALPSFRLNRQPRTFPKVRPDADTTYLLWPDSTASESIRRDLDRLCAKVTYLGHSASVVQMWVEDSPPTPTLVPAMAGEYSLRIACSGTLAYLVEAYNASAREAHATLQDQVALAKGKAKTELKRELAERFPVAPATVRPSIGLWQSYQPPTAAEQLPPSGAFDHRLMVFAIDSGPSLGLASTWQFLTAVRNAILAACDPTPDWVSGHLADGRPLQQAHLAIVPLPFVGREHADGHLLGMALAFPKEVAPQRRAAALKNLLYNKHGEPQPITIYLGRLGEWRLARERRAIAPLSLKAETWARPGRLWATVTPIALDRQPKADRATQRERWNHDAAEIIAESCVKQGLPRPVEVRVDKTSCLLGVPRAVGSGGFPLMPVKPGTPPRQQTHARLEFAEPILGPLLLGAGRYRGYGLCRPCGGGAS